MLKWTKTFLLAVFFMGFIYLVAALWPEGKWSYEETLLRFTISYLSWTMAIQITQKADKP